MDKFIKIWEPVLRSFKNDCPEYYERMVDWYPSGHLEIMIKLDDGERITYDLVGNRLRMVRLRDRYAKDETDWRKNFSYLLNEKMRKLGLTQDRLSEMTGISRVTIHKYATGKATPSSFNLERMADAMNCSTYELTYARERNGKGGKRIKYEREMV